MFNRIIKEGYFMPSINLTISLREAACVDYRMTHRTYRSQRLPLYAWT
jgi:hypothetical protein